MKYIPNIALNCGHYGSVKEITVLRYILKALLLRLDIFSKKILRTLPQNK